MSILIGWSLGKLFNQFMILKMVFEFLVSRKLIWTSCRISHKLKVLSIRTWDIKVWFCHTCKTTNHWLISQSRLIWWLIILINTKSLYLIKNAFGTIIKTTLICANMFYWWLCFYCKVTLIKCSIKGNVLFFWFFKDGILNFLPIISHSILSLRVLLLNWRPERVLPTKLWHI